MKFNKIIIGILLIAFVITVNAQDNRIVKTKVADILALLPAQDNAQAERLFVELSNLGEDGIKMVTDQVQPNGNPDGVPYRFAVSLLTHYATNAMQKAVIEKVYIYALTNSSNTEVKAYFMDNLKWIGSDAAVKSLSGYISNKDLYNQAISALQIIGTSNAREALLTALGTPPDFAHAKLIQAVGELKEISALAMIAKATSSDKPPVRKQALWSLAVLADPTSSDLLVQAAKQVGFKNDPSEATNALVEYIHNVKDSKIIATVSRAILAGTAVADPTNPSSQQHYRLAALEFLAKSNPMEAGKVLLAELHHFDAEYRKEVLKIAARFAGDANDLKLWEKEYKKSTGATQAEVLAMMSSANRNDAFIYSTLIPALKSSNEAVRMVAGQEIALDKNKKFAPDVVDYLIRCTDSAEVSLAKADVLQMANKDNTSMIAQKIASAPAKSKITLIQILGERRSVSSFDVILSLTVSMDTAVKAAALKALPMVSTGQNVTILLQKLSSTDDGGAVKSFQLAIIAGIDANTLAQVNEAYPVQKAKLLPIFPYLNDKSALDKVVVVFNTGAAADKQIAFNALVKWQNSDAIRTLLTIAKDPSLQKYHAAAFTAGVKQISNSSLPDDEKLSLLKEFMPVAPDKQGKTQVVKAAEGVRTLPSLEFVAGYLDDKELGSVASRVAMHLALTTADAKPGMTGSFVRRTLEKIQARLVGEDSQYEQIDVATYLAKLPADQSENLPYVLTDEEKKTGFELLFNGKDLSLWTGNKTDYVAENNTIAVYPAKESHGNLATIKEYSNFILRFEFQLTPGANNGIGIHAPIEGDAAYLGKEIQVLDDTAPVYAKLEPWQYHGSIYGIIAAKKGFLKPVGEWNKEEIEVKGDYFKVTLNGTVITEGDVKKLSKSGTLDHKEHPGLLRHKGPIQFLGHGSVVKFKDLRVKEIK